MKSLVIGTAVLAATVATASMSVAADIPFKAIEKQAASYAKSVGCYQGGPDPKLVTQYEDKPNGIEKAYIAVVSSDSNCDGGSGTSTANLVFLSIASGKAGIEDKNPDYLKANPVLSEPIARSDAPTRFLTSLYQKNGQLYATGLEFGSDDANCCPSLKTIYKITLNKKLVTMTKDDNRSLYTWNFVKIKNYQ